MMLPAGDKYYEGVGAGKTGFTSIALNTLVTTAERDGRSLIAVVLHCPGAQYTYSDTKTLFDYGFENFTTLKPLEEFNLKAVAEESGVPEEAMKKLEEVNVLFNGNYAITASKKVELSDIKISVTTENAADGLWGSICFTYQNEEIGRANIYYDADEEYLSILEQDTIITETAAKVPFILVGVMAFLVIMILYLSISMFIRRKR